jgi:DNA polymerase III epsilon subunit-like protein
VDFLAWIENIKEKTIAGHNPSFDRDFLQATAYRYHLNWPMAHRTIDLHTVCYFDMIKKGVEPPTLHGHSSLNSDSIYRYLGMPDEPKPHNALTGAKMEAEAFSRLFYGKPLSN